MKLTRRLMIGALSATALLTQPIIASAQNLPKNIRMVIGSKSTGGDRHTSVSFGISKRMT